LIVDPHPYQTAYQTEPNSRGEQLPILLELPGSRWQLARTDASRRVRECVNLNGISVQGNAVEIALHCLLDVKVSVRAPSGSDDTSGDSAYVSKAGELGDTG